MRRTVTGSVVAANAFISTKQNILSKKQLNLYVKTVREKVNHLTDTFIGEFDAEVFLSRYDFIFGTNKDRKYIYILSEVNEEGVLEGYFRENLPIEFIKILDETGKELMTGKIETDNSSKSLIKGR